MVPKRKLVKKLNALRGCLNLVLEAVEKVGCEIEDFFAHAEHAVQVPAWFVPGREFHKFKRIHEGFFGDYPNYQVPACILAFAQAVLAAASPTEYFDKVLKRARRRQHEQMMPIPCERLMANIAV